MAKIPTLPEITQSVCYYFIDPLSKLTVPLNIIPSGKVGQIVA